MQAPARQRVCLSMIVKDEAAVIARCLASVRSLIDCWCIVDTGSSDSTCAVIEAAMGDLPGALHRRPWRGFAHNRNEALNLSLTVLAQLHEGARQLADSDYLMVIDADETLHLPAGYVRPELRAAAYDLELRFGDTRYARPSLLAVAAGWRYVGVLHEYLQSPQQTQISKLAGPWIEVRPEGARSRNPRKFHDDAALLEAALTDEPDNSRYWFYLGQSYRDAGDLPAALRAYRHRAELPGWEEETWYTHLQIALLTERVSGAQDIQQIQSAYDIAYLYRPGRAETLVELARWHRLHGRYAQALLYARGAVQIPPTTDRLFVDHSAYSWRGWDEYSISAFYCQCFSEGTVALQRLLAADPPKEHLPRIRENARHYQQQGWAIELGAALASDPIQSGP